MLVERSPAKTAASLRDNENRESTALLIALDVRDEIARRGRAADAPVASLAYESGFKRAPCAQLGRSNSPGVLPWRAPPPIMAVEVLARGPRSFALPWNLKRVRACPA